MIQNFRFLDQQQPQVILVQHLQLQPIRSVLYQRILQYLIYHRNYQVIIFLNEKKCI